MFWTLCTIVCLAIFLIVTVIGTVLANLAAGLLGYRKLRAGVLRLPGLLFSLRILPVAVGLAITFSFALPAFLLLEPTQTVERPDLAMLLLASCAVLVLSVFVARAVRLLLATRRIVGGWGQTAKPLQVKGVSVPVYVIEKPDSLIAVAGFFRPKIFLGRRAFASLTEDELRAACAHEFAHVRSLDNLKQLVLHMTRLPKCFRHLASVEASWSQASEFAADQKALENGTSPLDLASTLVKIGKLKIVRSATRGMAVSHLVPSSCSSAVAMRVQRLQSLLRETSPLPTSSRRQIAYPALGLLMAGTYLMILPTTLPIMHRLIEWLVR